MLFTKIREELSSQLTDNLKKINTEISEIKTKQSMMSTMETRKVEEQRQLSESIQKPAEMLEEMKEKWEGIMSEQQTTMRDLINQTVVSAIQKEQANRKVIEDDSSNLGAANSAQTKFFEKKIEQFEAEFRDKEQEIKNLRSEKR